MIGEAVRRRLQTMDERHDELLRLLGEPDNIKDPAKLKTLSQEFSRLEPIVTHWRDYQRQQRELDAAAEFADSDDDDMRALARATGEAAAAARDAHWQAIQGLLAGDDEPDCDAFVEIRAGTGGSEAALFAGDLMRMYLRYAAKRGWRTETLNETREELGGWKEIIMRFSGEQAFALMRLEAGTHRVQRVPKTEAQGRIHTSACTVATLPDRGEVEAIDIPKSELRVDTFRASGAGGQHVNKTDSAVRITHLPTNISAECQRERSQMRNRQAALSLLQAKLQQKLESEQRQNIEEQRRKLVGSGDRSEKIRTYNFPQGRITDHRINMSLHQLESVLEGGLDPLHEALSEHRRQQRLAAIED